VKLDESRLASVLSVWPVDISQNIIIERHIIGLNTVSHFSVESTYVDAILRTSHCSLSSVVVHSQ